MTGFNSKRQAAQPQAEPVAWRRPGKHFGYVYEDGITSFAFDSSATPLYTHPAAPVPAVPDLAHKPTVQRLMDLARQFRSAPSDLYDEPYKALQQACYAALAARPAPAVQSAARAIADEQSYDTGLWFVATTASEAHLQAALRRLTAAVEGEAP